MAARWFDRFAVDWKVLKVDRTTLLWDGGRFTVVEHPRHGKRGLTVRPVDEADRQVVWKRGGFLSRLRLTHGISSNAPCRPCRSAVSTCSPVSGSMVCAS